MGYGEVAENRGLKPPTAPVTEIELLGAISMKLTNLVNVGIDRNELLNETNRLLVAVLNVLAKEVIKLEPRKTELLHIDEVLALVPENIRNVLETSVEDGQEIIRIAFGTPRLVNGQWEDTDALVREHGFRYVAGERGVRRGCWARKVQR